MQKEAIKKMKLSDCQEHIHDGYLLSMLPTPVWYKPWTFWTMAVAMLNENRICHTAMAGWWYDHLIVVQMTSTPDRIVLLSDYVKKYPGKIIVSRPVFMRREVGTKALNNMIAITEKKYGWVRILLLGLSHTFTGGKLFPKTANDSRASCWPPVCSEAYSQSMREAGFDPCKGLEDSRTEPHHLFESVRMMPMFILV
jgi:hypothetical protein